MCHADLPAHRTQQARRAFGPLGRAEELAEWHYEAVGIDPEAAWDDLLERGEQLRWVPEYMKVRYEDWVNGLMGDWNITRQRFFGVPFPI